MWGVLLRGTARFWGVSELGFLGFLGFLGLGVVVGVVSAMARG